MHQVQLHDNALGGDRDAHVRRPSCPSAPSALVTVMVPTLAPLPAEALICDLNGAVHERGHAPRGLGVGDGRELGLGVLGGREDARRCRRPRAVWSLLWKFGLLTWGGLLAMSLLGTPMHPASCAAPGKLPLPLFVLGDDGPARGHVREPEQRLRGVRLLGRGGRRQRPAARPGRDAPRRRRPRASSPRPAPQRRSDPVPARLRPPSVVAMRPLASSRPTCPVRPAQPGPGTWAPGVDHAARPRPCQPGHGPLSLALATREC